MTKIRLGAERIADFRATDASVKDSVSTAVFFGIQTSNSIAQQVFCKRLNNHRLKPVGLYCGLKVRIRVD